MNTNDSGDVKRRDRHYIVVEILRTAVEGKIKTHIMYKAKLSYAQLNEYLPLLIENGFLENTSVKQRRLVKRVYKTTDKGLKFLENFDSVKKLWSYPTNSSV
jgi:predicted transcriptional regulator